MSTPGRAPLRAFAHRRAPRCPLAVPVRITVLRAGATYSVTGRALNLGEGGIAVALADEVRVADSVAVEFLLPDLGLGLQAKATLRYRATSHSGFEFRSLTRHQQAVIREWTRQRQPQSDQDSAPLADPPEKRRARYYPKATAAQLKRLVWPLVAVLAFVLLMVWWHWESAWRELEDQIPRVTSRLSAPALAEFARLHPQSNSRSFGRS